jgi:hypothetical protein
MLPVVSLRPPGIIRVLVHGRTTGSCRARWSLPFPLWVRASRHPDGARVGCCGLGRRSVRDDAPSVQVGRRRWIWTCDVRLLAPAAKATTLAHPELNGPLGKVARTSRRPSRAAWVKLSERRNSASMKVLCSSARATVRVGVDLPAQTVEAPERRVSFTLSHRPIPHSRWPEDGRRRADRRSECRANPERIAGKKAAERESSVAGKSRARPVLLRVPRSRARGRTETRPGDGSFKAMDACKSR